MQKKRKHKTRGNVDAPTYSSKQRAPARDEQLAELCQDVKRKFPLLQPILLRLIRKIDVAFGEHGLTGTIIIASGKDFLLNSLKGSVLIGIGIPTSLVVFRGNGGGSIQDTWQNLIVCQNAFEVQRGGGGRKWRIHQQGCAIELRNSDYLTRVLAGIRLFVDVGTATTTRGTGANDCKCSERAPLRC